jgi:glycosyltransferase involved in cell wall biosynthesis
MVITSLMEGGAHVVSQAIAMGVPVIASNIAGNRGLLGEDYLGYFEVGNTDSLQQILQRVELEPHFYDQLVTQISARTLLIQPEREMQSIGELLKKWI